MPILPALVLLAPQGLNPRDAAKLLPPANAAPSHVASLDRAALRRLLVRQNAGGDVDDPITVSAARTVVPGRAYLRLYGADGVDAQTDDILFNVVNGAGATATVTLKGLKKGATYLALVNLDATNVHARLVYGTPDLGLGVLESDAPYGPGNLPCVFKAVAKEQSFLVAFTRKSAGAATVHLSSIDLHLVK